VDWCGLWAQDPGDEQILACAYREKRILFTMDKDFGELAILKGTPHSGLVRLQGFTSRELAVTIHAILLSHETHLIDGSLIVATPKKLRVRPA
jgi:predicted nuclease of predicted toxin-antitoxin system